jgi:uncharacterized protein (UPF0248 family)
MVYRVMGKLLWKDGLPGAEITILHRGAPGDKKMVRGEDVLEVKPGHFTYRNSLGEDTVIPNHRILEVRKHGKRLWKRTGEAQASG